MLLIYKVFIKCYKVFQTIQKEFLIQCPPLLRLKWSSSRWLTNSHRAHINFTWDSDASATRRAEPRTHHHQHQLLAKRCTSHHVRAPAHQKRASHGVNSTLWGRPSMQNRTQRTRTHVARRFYDCGRTWF